MSTTTNNLAIIPARGGSKRIPRKNIRDFLGIPIIAYSITTALNSGLFNEVMVSTDDDEIAQIAQQYGASIPFFRSSKNADDFSTTQEVLNEVLSKYKTELGKTFDFCCRIYPAAPFIRQEHLKGGFDMLLQNEVASVFPGVVFSYPIWRGVVRDEKDKVKMIWPDYANSRSQDLKKVYHDAGQWSWFRVNSNWEQPFESSAMFEIPEIEVQDIDTETDWSIAELKYRYLYKTKTGL